MQLKTNVELALFFLNKKRSFSVVGKHLRNRKKVGLLAVEINPKHIHCLGKKMKNDDFFDLAVRNSEKMISYASERLRTTYIQN